MTCTKMSIATAGMNLKPIMLSDDRHKAGHTVQFCVFEVLEQWKHICGDKNKNSCIWKRCKTELIGMMEIHIFIRGGVWIIWVYAFAYIMCKSYIWVKTHQT